MRVLSSCLPHNRTNKIIRHILFFPSDTGAGASTGGVTTTTTPSKVVCLSYLRGLVSRLSDYEEEEGRVMPHLRSARTVPYLVAMLAANHRHLGAEAAAVGAEALAHICGTEDFVTYRVRDRNNSTR